MAVTLQLTDGTTTVNLANSTGPELQERYLPVFAEPTGDGTIPPDVTEAVPVYLNITSDDNLASTLQDIAALQRRAAEYMADEHQITPVWFHRKLSSETGAVRYLVKSIHFTPNAGLGGPFDNCPTITDGRLGVLSIKHHPYGERTSALSAAGTDDVSVLGGAVDYTSTDVVGDVPARAYYIEVDDLPTAKAYRQYWIGFRSDNRVSTPSNVASLWEIEDGSPGQDTTEVNLATASPGGGGDNLARCTFASNPTTWDDRATIVMSSVTANYGDQAGEFVVLLRAKVDTGVAQVKLRQHGHVTTVYRYGPVVDISETSWTLYNLGTVKFPLRDYHGIPSAMYAATYDQKDALEIWARAKPGETQPDAFDMDCLVLIPCDEYFIHVMSAEVSQTTGDAMRICVSPEDTASVISVHSSNYFNAPAPVEVIGTGVPTGDGRMFICAAQNDTGTSPAYDDDVDALVCVIPRWVHFGGAETA